MPTVWDMDNLEEFVAKEPDSPLQNVTMRLLSLVRSLGHQLDDPNYKYGGSRISRYAILSRNAEIEKLQEKLKAMEVREADAKSV